MMMILHQMRHKRQDNHATNHVRCVLPFCSAFMLHYVCIYDQLIGHYTWFLVHVTRSSQVYENAQGRAKQKAHRVSKQSETITSETCGVQRLPSKAVEKHPVNAYGGNATTMHGREGT
jgi:hypothetical protein